MKAEGVIWTEGKTDWQHMKHAFRVLNIGQNIAFHESDEDFGDNQLLKQCMALALVPQPCPTIFIFDRDKDDIITKVDNSDIGFRDWGNNVYSFALPIPDHRKEQPRISVEFYYSDKELLTQDASGRRLFLSSEFNVSSGRHKEVSSLSLGNKGKIHAAGPSFAPRLIDTDVYNERNDNVALTKAAFLRSIVQEVPGFDAFDFTAFRCIFSRVDEIIKKARPAIDLTFGTLEEFLERLRALEPPDQLAAVVEAIISASKLLATIFTAVTLRYYEQRITSETTKDAKRLRPIRHALIRNFDHPSLSILAKLAQSSYHLVDDDAPAALCVIREVLVGTPVLGPLGELLDDLERLIPPPSIKRRTGKARSVNKHQLKKPLMEYLLPEFAKYEGHLTEISELAATTTRLQGADPSVWQAAIVQFVSLLSPLKSLTFRIRNLDRKRIGRNEFNVVLMTYNDGRVGLEESTQTYEDLKDDQLETYELVLDSADEFLDLYPFILINNERLFYYKRTGSSAHEYTDALSISVFRVATRRKFSHIVMRTRGADKQSLFWEEVDPTVSDTGVKANIPIHGPIVGRKQQIALLMDEVIQIANQNAIIYGPGGVGKTALLIELSKQLAVDETPPRFKNVVWISAKRDYYNPTSDEIEADEPQFHSLDNILVAIMDFHGFEDAVAYDYDAKKWLVLELLRDEKTLLVLDNLESITPADQQEIVRFFGVEAKKALRRTPDQFKVLITSRELIPSGFHQVELKGLDKVESTELIQTLFEPYLHSGQQPLTIEQTAALYEVTRGIPLIIKHCLGQVYEYNRPLEQVLRQLAHAGNKVVDFSFAEILSLLKSDDLQLRIILLLEVAGRPLMLRQVTDTLNSPELAITERLARLVAFQCVDRSTTSTSEKYTVSDEVHFFTQRLAQEYADVATDIRRQFASLSFEKRMDYSQEEFDTVMLFQDYIAKKHYLPAEDFIRERLSKHPTSVLLSFHYAKYLHETKRKTEEAIELLEKVRGRSGNDPQILSLLMLYYTAIEPPRFEQAHLFARELEDIAETNKQVQFEIATFYATWSTAIKITFEPDRLKEGMRQQAYKDHADNALRILKECRRETHDWHYIAAQSHYNKWDYELALQDINIAIKLVRVGSYLARSYMTLRSEILEKRAWYDGRGSRHDKTPAIERD